MIKNILFFSSDEPEDSKSNRYHVAKILSKRFRVFYVYRQYLTILSLLKKPSRFKYLFKKNQYLNLKNQKNGFVPITPPLCLPGNSNFIKLINTYFIAISIKRILKKLKITNYLTWVVSPAQADLLKAFPGNFSVYHCHDGYAYYPGVNRLKILEAESKLKKRVNLIFYASKFLFEKTDFITKSHYIGHGFDPVFLKCDEYILPDDIKKIPKPIVGFHGIFNFHSDEELLDFLLMKHPNISFVFVGPIHFKKAHFLKHYSNFYNLGQKKFIELPGYLKGFDLAILPYKINEMTNVCSPLKLYEYLASGLPILSTDIPEVHVHENYINIAKNKEEFSMLIPKLLLYKHNKKHQREYAKNHLWEKKVDYMIQAIQNK